jgi:FkbM family methyltransferase
MSDGNLAPVDRRKFSQRAPMGPVEKVTTLVRTVSNWPIVGVDKAGLRHSVTYKLRSGAQFVCRTRTPDINEVVAVCSGFEYPIELIGGLPPDAVVLDVGANVGAFSVFIAGQEHGHGLRGWAIEPFSENASLLRQNLQLNDSAFTVVELAISDHDGECRIETSLPPDSVCVTTDEVGERVSCARLSTFCGAQKIDYVDLLKMDVEGHEYSIIESDATFLGEHVARMILEWHDRPDGSREDIVSSLQGAFEITDVHRYRDRGVLHLENRSSIHRRNT